MSELHGGDVSHWQAGLNLAKTGWDYAIMKATDGTNFVDDHCDGFVNQAKAAGMKYGVYHFYEGGGSAEADYFVKHVSGYIGHALLALDFETHTTDVAGAKAFLDRVHSKTGVKPVIYFNRSVLTSNDWSSVEKADYGLWYARYTDALDSTSPWAGPALWQHTSSGHVAGYSGSLDLDTFYGDHAAWDAYAKGTTPAPEPAPTPTPAPSGDVDVDGWWGTDTTKLAQHVYGTSVDGKVSGQNTAYHAGNPGLVQGWQWETGSKITGSQLILAIQHAFNVDAADANGIWGPNTAKTLQRHYGITADGVVSGPSELVKALQRTWNAGKRH
jgi:GH25 family lysozyme M1 (1,4-beta-N-acetylmuramidase)